jgi:hypothetical protein
VPLTVARLTLTRKKKAPAKLTGRKVSLPAPGTVPTGEEDPFAPNPRPSPSPGGSGGTSFPPGGLGPGGLRPPGGATMRKKRSRKSLTA